MDRQHFYQIPESIEHHPYLRWQIDPRLRRYIHQRIPDEYLPIQVLAATQILVCYYKYLGSNKVKFCCGKDYVIKIVPSNYLEPVDLTQFISDKAFIQYSIANQAPFDRVINGYNCLLVSI